VKFHQPIGGPRRRKHYQFTAIDDCTRIRVLRPIRGVTKRPRSSFLDYLLERLPFKVEVIQTDNGGEFQGSFHWHLLDRGSGHFYIRPATPRLNEKVERSHRIDEEEFYRLLEGIVIDDTGLFNAKLRNGKTSTTSADLMAALVARLPLRATKSKATTRADQVIDLQSVAHLVGAAG